jgi:DNA-binding NtrC family response regulator
MSKFMTLLVEDDVFQREVLAEAIKDDGFEVIECTTAEAAELIIALSGTELQALVTGPMSGAELAEYARSRHPQMNIVVMSGTAVARLPAKTTFLQKPFEPDRLLEEIRN